MHLFKAIPGCFFSAFFVILILYLYSCLSGFWNDNIFYMRRFVQELYRLSHLRCCLHLISCQFVYNHVYPFSFYNDRSTWVIDWHRISTSLLLLRNSLLADPTSHTPVGETKSSFLPCWQMLWVRILIRGVVVHVQCHYWHIRLGHWPVGGIVTYSLASSWTIVLETCRYTTRGSSWEKIIPLSSSILKVRDDIWVGTTHFPMLW